MMVATDALHCADGMQMRPVTRSHVAVALQCIPLVHLTTILHAAASIHSIHDRDALYIYGVHTQYHMDPGRHRLFCECTHHWIILPSHPDMHTVLPNYWIYNYWYGTGIYFFIIYA